MNQSGAVPELASTAPGYKADECANSIRTEELHQILNRASVAAWTKHIEELGAICVRDIAEMSAEVFTPMPIIAAHRMIRYAKEHIDATVQTEREEVMAAQFRAGVTTRRTQ